MSALRLLLPRHARAAWLLLALAGAVRLLVPAGFMPGFADGGVGLIVCTGMAPAPTTHAMLGMAQGHDTAMPGMAHGHHGDETPAKTDTVCPFAALSLPGLAGADPIALAPPPPAVAPVALRRPGAPPSLATFYLRPPSQGPPRIG